MSLLLVSLFGRFQVRDGDEQSPLCIEGRKEQELLCYLLLYRDRPHSRETLADLLWNDISSTRSKGYLRKALWQLQTALDSQTTATNRPLLLIEADWIRLNPQADFWLDIREFEKTFDLVQGKPGSTLNQAQIQAIKNALDLYQGELLENWYHDWCLYERERFQHLCLAMHDKLLDYYEAHHDYEAGLAYGLHILRYDRARERTHRKLMRLLYLIGDRTAALQQYERCAAALDEELDVKPSQRTISLYEQIRDGTLELPAPAFPANEPATPVADKLLPQLLMRLKQLQDVLFHFQNQVQEDIEMVERVTSPHR